MRDGSLQFVVSLTDEVTSIIRLWVVETKIGRTFYLTDSDVDVTTVIDEEVITFSSTEGFSASAVALSTGSGMQGFEVETALYPDPPEGEVTTKITRRDVDNGLFDGAKTRMYAFNRRGGVGQTPTVLYDGEIADIEYTDERKASFDVVSKLTASGGSILVDTYSPLCRAEFCDSACRLSFDDYSLTFVADASPDGNRNTVTSDVFDEPAPSYAKSFWSNGTIEFTSGRNIGIITEISNHNGTSVSLYLDLPYPVEAGDEGIIYRGCDKTLQNCKQYFNSINFRGEPFKTYTPSVQEVEEQITREVEVQYEEIVYPETKQIGFRGRYAASSG